jgi:hypothetical protein
MLIPATMGEQTVTLPDLEKASTADLQNILETSDEDLAAQLTNPEAAPIVPPKEGEPPKPTPEPQETTGLEVDLGEGKKIKFKDQDELLKQFVNLRKGIDGVTAKHSQTTQELLRLKPLEGEVMKLKTQLEELQRGKAQAAAGQQPTAVSPATVKEAAALGVDLSDITPENFTEKIDAFLDAKLQKRNADLETVLQTKFSEQVAAIETRNKALEEKFGKIEGEMTFREQSAVYEKHLTNLMTEIGQLQAKVGDVLKTQWPVREISDLISNEGADIARLKLPPGDFEKYEIIESLLAEAYCPVDAQGNIDITQRKLKNINAAWAAFITDHPELAPTDVARARAEGAEAVTQTIARVASQPPKLPNNLSTQTGNAGMTLDEAAKLVQTSVVELNKWKRLKDPRYQKYLEAQEFISNAPNEPPK